MIKAAAPRPGASPSRELLTPQASTRDNEARLAATLHSTAGEADPQVIGNRAPRTARVIVHKGADAQAHSVAAEIARAVETRLPGRVRDLQVTPQQDHFVLSGVSNSYYVKQVAGHLAMNAMDARLLGRLLNEIEVRSVR